MNNEDAEDWPFWTSKSTGKEHCDEAEALSQMLASDGLLFVSGGAGPFFKIDEKDKIPASIYVNCNDLWIWACADAEPLPMDQIGIFYKAWKADGEGVKQWCCVQRDMQPQEPIRKNMREAGTWTDVLEALPKNPDDK